MTIAETVLKRYFQFKGGDLKKLVTFSVNTILVSMVSFFKSRRVEKVRERGHDWCHWFPVNPAQKAVIHTANKSSMIIMIIPSALHLKATYKC